jgi:hypothetical protein
MGNIQLLVHSFPDPLCGKHDFAFGNIFYENSKKVWGDLVLFLF